MTSIPLPQVKNPFTKLALSLISCLCGYFICALGNVMMLNANLGMNPWGVLHQGISLQTGLTLGQATQSFGLLLIALCLIWKVIPGLGTLLNMLCIGLFMDIISAVGLLPFPQTLVMRWAFLLLGSIMQAFGSFVYLRQLLGAGPKDGVMLLLAGKLSLNVGTVRVGMEIIACIAGVLLGGKLGLGTIVCAFSFGPTLAFFFKQFKVDTKRRQENVADTIRRLKQTGKQNIEED